MWINNAVHFEANNKVKKKKDVLAAPIKMQ